MIYAFPPSLLRLKIPIPFSQPTPSLLHTLNLMISSMCICSPAPSSPSLSLLVSVSPSLFVDLLHSFLPLAKVRPKENLMGTPPLDSTSVPGSSPTDQPQLPRRLASSRLLFREDCKGPLSVPIDYSSNRSLCLCLSHSLSHAQTFENATANNVQANSSAGETRCHATIAPQRWRASCSCLRTTTTTTNNEHNSR